MYVDLLATVLADDEEQVTTTDSLLESVVDCREQMLECRAEPNRSAQHQLAYEVAYDRALVDTLNACSEVNTFIPALAYTFAASPTEIEVEHEARHAGQSKYSLYALIRLNFDLVTGFSTVPLQWFSLIGMILSLLAGALFVLLLVRRFILGAEVEGVFTLFALQFFLTGIILFGISLMGEYVGRIQQEVRRRPRYRISTVLEAQPGAQAEAPPTQPAGTAA